MRRPPRRRSPKASTTNDGEPFDDGDDLQAVLANAGVLPPSQRRLPLRP